MVLLHIHGRLLFHRLYKASRHRNPSILTGSTPTVCRTEGRRASPSCLKARVIEALSIRTQVKESNLYNEKIHTTTRFIANLHKAVQPNETHLLLATLADAMRIVSDNENE